MSLFAKWISRRRAARLPAFQSNKTSDDFIQEGDRLRDAREFSAAAAAYRAALALAPARPDIWVQFANMLKDAGSFQEAEAGYRSALALAPLDPDTHLQLGHLFKLQGRRRDALASYRRAAEIAPHMFAARLEAFNAGDPENQEYMFDAELRFGSIDKLLEISHQLEQLRSTIDHIVDTLPNVQARVAIPVGRYDQFRNLYTIPEPPRSAASEQFLIILLSDREPLDILRNQIVRILKQTYERWSLRVVGSDPARRRVVDQFAAADSRVVWVETAESETEAEAERRIALSEAADWILLLDKGACLDPNALAWIAAAAAGGAACAFVMDEERLTYEHGRPRYSHPQFRQVVDYDTLLEMNPFGETVAVNFTAYTKAASNLATASVSAARSSLLLQLARTGQIGHIPYPLIARAESIVAGAEQMQAHYAAVCTHLSAVGLDARVETRCATGQNARLSIRWRPQKPDAGIAVIIPTRDNGEDLLRCVESLRDRAQRPEVMQMIIVDNGTREAASRRILDQIVGRGWAQLQVIDQPFNWSRLNNAAAAKQNAELLVFVNDDIIMTSEGWDEILRGLLDRPEIGAIGARLLYPDESVQHAGIVFGWQGSSIHDGIGESAAAPGPASRWQVTRRVGAVTGAFLATRRDVFLTHGGFDEIGLPVAHSDIDYALKLRASDLGVLWTPEISCYHHESKSRGLDHLDPEKRARVAAESAILEERWGAALNLDPSINPVWHMATLPFRLISSPSEARVWAHITRCAARNPWAVAKTR
jgi:GT2 family glycosyltransferase/tetratricopeptide (TPR) repeat protein